MSGSMTAIMTCPFVAPCVETTLSLRQPSPNRFLKLLFLLFSSFQRESSMTEEKIFPINIRTLTGDTFTLIASSNTLIVELKEQIERNSPKHIPVFSQRLILSGRQLEDDRTLADYNITPNSTIHLVLKLMGGMFSLSSGRTGKGETLDQIEIIPVTMVSQVSIMGRLPDVIYCFNV